MVEKTYPFEVDNKKRETYFFKVDNKRGENSLNSINLWYKKLTFLE